MLRRRVSAFKRCKQIPPKSKAQFWIVAASAGTMSHFTGYATQSGVDAAQALA
jgi:hypothetical protein